MAVTLTQSPAATLAIDEPIVWGLSIDSLGTPGTNVKSIAYQLTETGGGAVIAESEIAPVAVGYNHRINFQTEIRKRLKTNIPALNITTVYDGAGVGKFKLKYGETTLDLTTGVVTGFPPSTDSAEITVINTTNNNVWDNLDPMGAAKLLTFKPTFNFFNREYYDWLYIWGAGTVTILKDYTITGGTVSGTTVVSLSATANRVNIVPIGYKNHAGLNGVNRYAVVCTVDGVTRNFFFHISETSAEGHPSQIIYFDPGGGYTAIDGFLTEVRNEATKEVISTYRPPKSLIEGGNLLVNSQGYRHYRFRRKFLQNHDVQEQLLRFAAAENYFIVQQTAWFKGLMRFEVTDSVTTQIQSGNMIELTGRIALPMRSANGRVITA